MDFTNEFEQLGELLRTVNKLISPETFSDKLKWLTDRDMKKKLFERYPKCFLPVRIGQLIPFLPICNRSGMVDPDLISFSLRLANKLRSHDNVDQEHLSIQINRLNRLYNVYSKDIPKPPNMAATKGNVTKNVNIIKQYLDRIR